MSLTRAALLSFAAVAVLAAAAVRFILAALQRRTGFAFGRPVTQR